jgi:hypothetical protein
VFYADVKDPEGQLVGGVAGTQCNERVGGVWQENARE